MTDRLLHDHYSDQQGISYVLTMTRIIDNEIREPNAQFTASCQIWTYFEIQKIDG